jgi:hypothetical protein
MADKKRPDHFQSVENGEDIVAESLGLIAAQGSTRCSESSACDADDPVVRDELDGEVVKDVGRVPEAGQQHYRRAITAPIQNLQAHVWRDHHEGRGVWGGIAPVCALSGATDRTQR